MHKCEIVQQQLDIASSTGGSETLPTHYQVICERCHKTIFFSGQGETIFALCDECAQ